MTIKLKPLSDIKDLLPLKVNLLKVKKELELKNRKARIAQELHQVQEAQSTTQQNQQVPPKGEVQSDKKSPVH